MIGMVTIIARARASTDEYKRRDGYYFIGVCLPAWIFNSLSNGIDQLQEEIQSQHNH